MVNKGSRCVPLRRVPRVVVVVPATDAGKAPRKGGGGVSRVMVWTRGKSGASALWCRVGERSFLVVPNGGERETRHTQAPLSAVLGAALGRRPADEYLLLRCTATWVKPLLLAPTYKTVPPADGCSAVITARHCSTPLLNTKPLTSHHPKTAIMSESNQNQIITTTPRRSVRLPTLHRSISIGQRPC